MKIDMVYLWVDGNDPKYLAKKDKALGRTSKKYDPVAVGKNRWNDNGELKYALRSVEKFIPWVNHIYIVTDNQIPKWLNTKNPKITIVDHSDIVPKEHLPLFNSAAIDLFVTNIKGLSEHYLFSNDDMFINRPLSPDFFFDEKGNPKIILKRKHSSAKVFASDKVYEKYNENKKLLVARMKNAIRFVYKKTGKKYSDVWINHVIEPRRKSYQIDIMNKYGPELIAATCTRIRERKNVQPMVFPLLDNALGRNTIMLPFLVFGHRVKRISGESLFRRLFLWKYRNIARFFGLLKTDALDEEYHFWKRLNSQKPAFFCINDTDENKNVFKEGIGKMNILFPDKSQFEK